MTFEHSHFSDHLALTTELDLPLRTLTHTPERSRPHWSKTNWDLYRTTLSTNHTPILTSLSNPAQADVDGLALSVNTAIDLALEALTPTVTFSQKSRRWWCAATIHPLKGHANNLRRKAQHTRKPGDRVIYRAAQNTFHQACKDAKVSHFQAFLANLSDKDLFTAAKYTSGPPAARTLPTLRRPDGQLTSNPEEQAHLIFQATGGPTIPCDLADVTPQPTLEPFNAPFTTADVQQTIDQLKTGKSPVSDGITTRSSRSRLKPSPPS